MRHKWLCALALFVASSPLALGCGDGETTPIEAPRSVDETGQWPSGRAEDHGFDPSRLEDASRALAEPSTRSLLVIHDGEIIRGLIDFSL